jgi:hypothetical protein
MASAAKRALARFSATMALKGVLLHAIEEKHSKWSMYDDASVNESGNLGCFS